MRGRTVLDDACVLQRLLLRTVLKTTLKTYYHTHTHTDTHTHTYTLGVDDVGWRCGVVASDMCVLCGVCALLACASTESTDDRRRVCDCVCDSGCAALVDAAGADVSTGAAVEVDMLTTSTINALIVPLLYRCKCRHAANINASCNRLLNTQATPRYTISPRWQVSHSH